MIATPSDQLAISHFEKCETDSVDYALSNKDAVFSSIFDMTKINKTCGLYKPNFAHNLTSMKTVRLLGTSVKTCPETTSNKYTSNSYIDDIIQNSMIAQEHMKGIHVLKDEISILEQELKELERVSQQLAKENQQSDIGEQIKSLKDQSKCLKTDSERSEAYAEINDLKLQHDKQRMFLIASRSTLSKLKQAIYFKRIAVRYDAALKKQPSKENARNISFQMTCESAGVHEADSSGLNGAENFTFFVTDNGLAHMSTSIPFTLNRYKFHLNLYNRYQILEDTNVNIKVDEEQYLDLPKPLTINAADVDVGCMITT